MKKIFFLCAMCASMTAFATEGALSGKFTINANGDQIQFAQGNLQYQASTDTWQFAANQWDIIGTDNDSIGDPNYTGWIDLFGWGTGANPTQSSLDDANYATFVDWGTNAISNGANTPNMWRTLTGDEWEYILKRRANIENLRAFATVNGTHGLIILPDDWTTPAGLSIVYLANIEGDWKADWTTNTYDGADWTTMEDNGAVFLPAAAAARMIEGFPIAAFLGVGGMYWASTNRPSSPEEADDIMFALQADEYGFVQVEFATGTGNAHYGESVRLVLDIEITTGVENLQSNNTGCKKILRNGQLLIEKNGKTYNALGNYAK